MSDRAIYLDLKKGWCISEHWPSELAGEHGQRIVGIVPIDPLYEFTDPAVELAKQINAIPRLIEIAQAAALAGDDLAKGVLYPLGMLPEGIDFPRRPSAKSSANARQ